MKNNIGEQSVNDLVGFDLVLVSLNHWIPRILERSLEKDRPMEADFNLYMSFFFLVLVSSYQLSMAKS